MSNLSPLVDYGSVPNAASQGSMIAMHDLSTDSDVDPPPTKIKWDIILPRVRDTVLILAGLGVFILVVLFFFKYDEISSMTSRGKSMMAKFDAVSDKYLITTDKFMYVMDGMFEPDPETVRRQLSHLMHSIMTSNLTDTLTELVHQIAQGNATETVQRCNAILINGNAILSDFREQEEVRITIPLGNHHSSSPSPSSP